MHPHLASRIFDRPHLIEPSAGRTIIGALGQRLAVDSLAMPDGTQFDVDALGQAAADAPGRPRQTIYERHGAIARIRVEGTLAHRFGFVDPVSGMTGYDSVEQKLDAALADDDIDGILLDIDSPGGEVSGCFDLCDVIRSARDTKPIWALCDELCCSAAYALASACTRIVAPATASIGSIGVLTAHIDQSQKMANEGLVVTLIHAGERKVDGNPYEPMPDSVRQDKQADIDRLYDRFTALVADNRGISQQVAKETEARVFSTEQAVANGLADEVMPARKALSAFNQSLRGPSRLQSIGNRTMSIFNRSKPEAQGVSLESLVALCGENNLASLAQPLYEQGATQEYADAVVTDANDIRDRLAATFVDDLNAGAKLADRFIHAAYGSAQPELGNAVGSLMAEASARMAGEEIDHHPPVEDMDSSQQSDNSHYFEQV